MAKAEFSDHGADLSHPMLLVTGGFPEIRVLDPDLTPKFQFKTLHHRWNRGLATFVSSNEFLVAAGRSGRSRFQTTVAIFDVLHSRFMHLLEGHRGQVELAAIEPSSSFSFPRLISGGQKTQCFLWNTLSGDKLIQLQGALSEIHRILPIPEWKKTCVVIGGGSWTTSPRLAEYDVERGTRRTVFRSQTSSAFGLCFDAIHGRLIATGHRSVLMWDLRTRKTMKSFSLSDFGTSCTMDNKRGGSGFHLLVGQSESADTSVTVFDTRMGSELHSFRISNYGVNDISQVGSRSFVGLAFDKTENVVRFGLTGKICAKHSLPSYCYRACFVGNDEQSGSNAMVEERLRYLLEKYLMRAVEMGENGEDGPVLCSVRIRFRVLKKSRFRPSPSPSPSPSNLFTGSQTKDF